MKINTKDLRLAEVRYFDVENNGLEYTPPLSYVVLLNRGDTYINLLNCGDFAPIYSRNDHESNIYNRDTEEYIGTKVELVCGEVQEGEAWLLNDTDFVQHFGCEEVEMADVEHYVLQSNLFFKDRIELATTVMNRHGLPFLSIKNIVKKDEKCHEEMRRFFAEREPQKVMKK